jgi:hypothetical protein
MEQLLIDYDVPHKLLSKKAGYEIQKQWLNIFARKVKEKTGKFQVGEFVWENFSSELEPAIFNEKAIEKYKGCNPEPIYIFDEGCRHCYLCNVKALPIFPERCGDIYILPESQQWTMVYDHMGAVYFALNKI